MKRLIGCVFAVGIIVTCMVGCKQKEEAKADDSTVKEAPAAVASEEAPKDHPAH